MATLQEISTLISQRDLAGAAEDLLECEMHRRVCRLGI